MSAASQAAVTCSAGRVRGNSRSDVAVREFLGIPFAHPPTGELRFSRPRLLERFSEDEVDATRRKTAPWQSTASWFPDERDACWIPKETLNEDCLHLNIWTSAQSRYDALPVLVWIYGGAFVTGSATLALYDGAILAARGRVVVVSINYRLGPFGFLYAPSHGCHGNMGLWDQQCALQWLASNVAAFGGDPNNVTLFGESAGSSSITAHLLCPSSWPLFQRVILQSGVLTNPWSILSSAEAVKIGDALIEAGGGWQSLMTIPPASLLDAAAETTDDLSSATYQPRFVPVVDGDFISSYPLALLQRGHFKKCPIMVGYNEDEGAVISLGVFHVTEKHPDNIPSCGVWPHFLSIVKDLVPRLPHDLSTAVHDFPRLPHDLSTKEQAVIAHEYFPWDSPKDLRGALLQLAADFYFLDGIVKWMRIISRQNGAGIFAYHFQHANKTGCWPEWCGAKHGDEIQFIFGDPLREDPLFDYTPTEKKLASSMIQIWSTFSTSKINENFDFNIDGRNLKWEHWSEDGHSFLTIDSDSIHFETISNHQRLINFWNNVIPQLNTWQH